MSDVKMRNRRFHFRFLTIGHRKSVSHKVKLRMFRIVIWAVTFTVHDLIFDGVQFQNTLSENRS